MMVRWMSGVHLKSGTDSADLNSGLAFECITDVIRRSRLLWFVVMWTERIVMIEFSM